MSRRGWRAVPRDGRDLGHPVPTHQGRGRGALSPPRWCSPARCSPRLADADRRRQAASLRPLLRYWRPLRRVRGHRDLRPMAADRLCRAGIVQLADRLLIAAVPLSAPFSVGPPGHEPLDSRRWPAWWSASPESPPWSVSTSARRHGALVVAAWGRRGLLRRGPAHPGPVPVRPARPGVVAVSLAVSAIVFLPVGAAQWPPGRCPRRPGSPCSPSRSLHCHRLPRTLPPDRRGRAGQGHGDHLPEPRCGAGAGRPRARRVGKRRHARRASC